VPAVIVPTLPLWSLVQMLWFIPLGLVVQELERWEPAGKVVGVSPHCG